MSRVQILRFGPVPTICLWHICLVSIGRVAPLTSWFQNTKRTFRFRVFLIDETDWWRHQSWRHFWPFLAIQFYFQTRFGRHRLYSTLRTKKRTDGLHILESIQYDLVWYGCRTNVIEHETRNTTVVVKRCLPPILIFSNQKRQIISPHVTFQRLEITIFIKINQISRILPYLTIDDPEWVMWPAW